jgi:ABC-type multidrug transport system fused ATPase/permease subunit|tara:strand:- start:37 stop:303 length:267 start_codon:yes stop_codon:yes gene_type:complete
MIKNFFSILIFLFIFLFIFFVISTYTSDENKKKIIENRSNIHSEINDRITSLPFLKNNTQNVIEFNSGYDIDNNKIKRNFWNLFKKND